MGFVAGTSGFGNPYVTPSPFGFGGVPLLGSKPAPTHDKFGLPLNWSLLGESQEQLQARMVAAITLLREVHQAVSYQLGETNAKVAWREITKRKPGRKKGRRKNPDRDARLLRLYDAALLAMDEKRRRSAPRLIAGHLTTNSPQEFRISAESIETHLRRLLRHREAERAVKAEADRKLAAALSGPNVFALADLGRGFGLPGGGNALA